MTDTKLTEHTDYGIRPHPVGQRPLVPCLKVVQPRDVHLRICLSSTPLIVGRGRDADVVVNDGRISRRHCLLFADESGVVVEDLNSTNGTLVNGAHVEKATLGGKDRLQLGNMMLKLEYHDAEELEREDRLYRQATTDELTGLCNRRWILEQGRSCIAAMKDSESYVSVVMLDVDEFKQINDGYGHPAGDAALRAVAGVLARERRRQDFLGRYGGEEFLLILPDASSPHARVVCERIRKAVADTPVTWNDARFFVTVSMGISSAAGVTIASLEDLIAEADEALYAAKRSGRNCVTGADEV